jgi:hypothetical protein
LIHHLGHRQSKLLELLELIGVTYGVLAQQILQQLYLMVAFGLGAITFTVN